MGTLKIEIFDEDKLGKNKLLGTSYIDIPNLANNEPLDNVWIPLSGVKSGELQVSADFVPAEFHEYENIRPDQFNKMSPQRDSGSLGAPRSAKSPESEKLGKVKLDLLMAKDLIKNDMVGKSDPYAIITHGSQKFKTDIMKNTQNPEWNIQCEVEVPDSNDRNISIDLYDADKFGKDTFLGTLDQGWYPLDGVKQGQICVGADFIPEPDETSTIVKTHHVAQPIFKNVPTYGTQHITGPVRTHQTVHQPIVHETRTHTVQAVSQAVATPVHAVSHVPVAAYAAAPVAHAAYSAAPVAHAGYAGYAGLGLAGHGYAA